MLRNPSRTKYLGIHVLVLLSFFPIRLADLKKNQNLFNPINARALFITRPDNLKKRHA